MTCTCSSWRSTMAPVFFLVITCLSILSSPVGADLPRVDHHPTRNGGKLRLLVVGDWGRKGLFNQSEVAAQMGKVAEDTNIDFVVSTGDNFYEDGLKGTDDKAFKESFTNIYTAKSLQKQWYSVLGNHDYRGNVLAQLSPVLQNIDSRWLCMRSFVLDAEIVQFFFVDTTPFVAKYWEETDHQYDWRNVAPRDTYIKNLLMDLDSALKESTATWKFVVGHHTMRSVSDHGDTQELLQLLLPVLQANEVDLYINGHDHCLQHISSRDSPIQYLTSGGGSKAWRGVYTPNSDNLQFFYDGQGFMSMQVSDMDVEVAFYDVFGKVLHTLSINKGLHHLISPSSSTPSPIISDRIPSKYPSPISSAVIPQAQAAISSSNPSLSSLFVSISLPLMFSVSICNLMYTF